MVALQDLSTSSEWVGGRVEVFTAVFVPVQIIVVALRYYARGLTNTAWQWDDLVVLISTVFQMALAGIGIAAVKQGVFGYHSAYTMLNDPILVPLGSKYALAVSAIYAFSINIPKLAILMLYHRIFPGCRVRMFVYNGSAILVAASVATTIAVLASCRPFAANWDVALQTTGECIDREALATWSAVPNFLTDLAMLIFPLHIVWGLPMDRSMKAGLTFAFLVGCLGLTTSIVRFSYLFERSAAVADTYADVKLMILTELEPGLYLIVASLLAYRPLLQKIGLGKLGEVAKATRQDRMSARLVEVCPSDASQGRDTPEDPTPGTSFHRMSEKSRSVSGEIQKLGDFPSIQEDSLSKHDRLIIVRTDVRIERDIGDELV